MHSDDIRKLQHRQRHPADNLFCWCFFSGCYLSNICIGSGCFFYFRLRWCGYFWLGNLGYWLWLAILILWENVDLVSLDDALADEHVVHGIRRLCTYRHPVLDTIRIKIAGFSLWVIGTELFDELAGLWTHSVLSYDNSISRHVCAPDSLHPDL